MNQPIPAPMHLALEEAERAAARGEVPVGAVIAGNAGKDIGVLGQPHGRTEGSDRSCRAVGDPRAARALGTERLIGCDLYVTLEPCAMCAAAASFARIRRLYFGAADPKMGAVENGPRLYHQPTCHHRPEVYGGIGEAHAARLLKSFFAERR